MKKKNVLGIIAGILFLLLAVVSLIGMVSDITTALMNEFNFYMLEELLEGSIVSSQSDAAYKLQNVGINGYIMLCSVIDAVANSILIAVFILYGIGNLKSKKSLVKAAASVSIGKVIYCFSCGIISLGYLFFTNMMIESIDQGYGITSVANIASIGATEFVNFLICLLMNIFILNLAKKSSNSEGPITGTMVTALVFIGIFVLYTLGTDVFSLIKTSADGISVGADNLFGALLEELPTVTEAIALVLMCIWLGKPEPAPVVPVAPAAPTSPDNSANPPQ